MFPDAAIDYIINHQETSVTEQQPEDERVNIDEVPLTLATTYHNAENPAAEIEDHIVLTPGGEPFVLFRMRQSDGAIVLEVDASLVEDEDELIETLEVFFETMLEERQARLSAATLRAVAEESSADQDDV